ncbi:hypothetical protein NDU88_004192 [Pleurodeles waltl]|uniref:Uncharacterized protein n=1 Tax=Pleurodeles waltl TaxID=8319 RepID=A0AAV7SI39_PLEWA|nr:hypothetical protein NDU88_004192 [Pleurodeles waltl]
MRGGGVTARLLLPLPPGLRFTSLPPRGRHSDLRAGSDPQHTSRFKFPLVGGSRWPGPPPRPQRGTASRSGGQRGPPVSRAAPAPRAPARRRSPGVLLLDKGGGPVGTPAAGIHRRGVPQLSPGLSPPLNLQQSSPEPTSDPPGASRSGRHLELLFTGSAEPPYEGEPPAFHQIASADFSTGPRDTGEQCTAFFAPLDRGS